MEEIAKLQYVVETTKLFKWMVNADHAHRLNNLTQQEEIVSTEMLLQNQ